MFEHVVSEDANEPVGDGDRVKVDVDVGEGDRRVASPETAAVVAATDE